MHLMYAHCKSCDYETELMVGLLRSYEGTLKAEAVHCSNCEAVTTASYIFEQLTCRKCNLTNLSPLTDPANYEPTRNADGETNLYQPFVTTDPSPDLNYKCPKCETFSLRFRMGNKNNVFVSGF